MTPKEKAKELYKKFSEEIPANICENIYEFVDVDKRATKKCASISVEEILNDDWYIATREDLIARKEYWEEVKKEINNL